MRIILVLGCLSSSAIAANAPVPRFEAPIIGIPPLSLRDSPRLEPNKSVQDPRKLFHGASNPVRAVPQLVSKMPIVEPNSKVDYKLRVIRPDDSKDYSMVVKVPNVESEK